MITRYCIVGFSGLNRHFTFSRVVEFHQSVEKYQLVLRIGSQIHSTSYPDITLLPRTWVQSVQLQWISKKWFSTMYFHCISQTVSWSQNFLIHSCCHMIWASRCSHLISMQYVVLAKVSSLWAGLVSGHENYYLGDPSFVCWVNGFIYITRTDHCYQAWWTVSCGMISLFVK